MTHARRLGALAILGLGFLCLGFAYDVVRRPPPAAATDPTEFEIASLDLADGSGDATLSATGMAPGDAVAAAITVTNSGKRSMVYGMRVALVSPADVALASALELTIRTVGSSCADFDGTVLYDGHLASATFGNPTDGRPLPAATADILCFRATLPADAGDALQGTSTTVRLMFDAGSPAAPR